jgi:hypothetical protein
LLCSTAPSTKQVQDGIARGYPLVLFAKFLFDHAVERGGNHAALDGQVGSIQLSLLLKSVELR